VSFWRRESAGGIPQLMDGVDGLYGSLPNHGVGELFLFGAGGCSFIQQAVDQSAQ
jgi:hypothetical protein